MMFRDSSSATLVLPSEIHAGVGVPDASFGRRRRPGAVLPLTLLVGIVAFVVVCYLHFGRDVPAYQLMDDPASYAKLEWYTGMLSNVVVLLWCAAAAVCGFAGYLLPRNRDSDLGRLGQFVALLAVFSLWMTLDDMLLLHEQISRHLAGREYQHHAEGVLFVLYGVVLAGFFWRFRATIARTDFAFLIGAVVCLLASAAIDVAFQLELGGNNLFRETILAVQWGSSFIDITEEMLKLTGAMFWFVYCVRAACRGLKDMTVERGCSTGSEPS